jgi:hypothetical protein
MAEMDCAALFDTKIQLRQYRPAMEDTFHHDASPNPGWLPSNLFQT